MGGPSTSIFVWLSCRSGSVGSRWGGEMGRREHTIDGVIAIDRVHDAPCGRGAFVPLASCCSLSSLASFLRWLALKIGCSRVSFVVLRIIVDMACLDGPLACHISGLVVARFEGHHHCCRRGRCGSRCRCVWSVVGEDGGLSCVMVVGRETLWVVSHAKSSIGVCRHPF
jgi:hypothetical protein